jgi:hypothetical protein
MAVLVVILLVAIVLMFLAGNARALYFLTREVRLIEKKQERRLAEPSALTNAPPVGATNTAPAPTQSVSP